MSQPAAPTPTGGISNKVVGSTAGVGVAGAGTILIDYLLQITIHLDLPSTVEQALTVLLCAGGAFIGGYLPKHGGSS